MNDLRAANLEDFESQYKRKAVNTNTDAVNHPPHYTQGSIECIDAIEAAVGELSGIEAVCTSNAIKYLWRWKQKNGVEDLKKAIWYINKLIEEKEDKNVSEKV